MPNACPFIRCDCADGAYKQKQLDLTHPDWSSSDHDVSYPGPVPILASRSSDRLGREFSFGGRTTTVALMQDAILVGLGMMAELKQGHQLRVYTHQHCGMYAALLGEDPSDALLQEELDYVVNEVLKPALPGLRIKGHLAIKTDEGWAISRPLAVAR